MPLTSGERLGPYETLSALRAGGMGEEVRAMRISERTVGDVTILDLKGRLILDDGFEPLRVAFNRLIGEGRRKVLLNLAGVTFLDSAGVGLIACKYVTLCRHNGQLKLCHLHSRSEEVLRATKLLTVFEAFASEADALKSFGASVL